MTSLFPDIVGGVSGSGDEDSDLVCAHLGGDPDAFERIVRRYRPAMLAAAQRRLGSRSDAEDAVQDCFERAYKGIVHLRDPYVDCRLGPWLLKILFNVCNDMLTRRGRQRALPERVAARELDVPWTEFDIPDPAETRSLGRALADLPSAQLEAFLLRELRGFGYPAVAEMTGVTEDNARARVHRARRTLQRRLSALQANILVVAGAVTGWRRVVPFIHRRAADLGRILQVQSPEAAGASGTSAAVAVVTVAAGLASVGTGAVVSQVMASSPPAAVSSRPLPPPPAASSTQAYGVTSAVTSIPVPATNPNPQPQVQPLAATIGQSKAVSAIPLNRGLAVTTGAAGAPDPGTTTTSVPPSSASSPGPSLLPVAADLTWVPTAETAGSPSGATATSAPPPPAGSGCAVLSSMPGSASLPAGVGNSLAGLQVTQLLSSAQPATETADGFAVFEGSAVLGPVGSAPSQTTLLRDTAAVCMSGSTQMMVADVSVPGSPGELQLRGPLVATTATTTTAGAYFRGVVDQLSPVSGVLGTLPSDFVGEVSCVLATRTCQLTIAFVGTSAVAGSPAPGPAQTTNAPPDSSADNSESGASGSQASGPPATGTSTDPYASEYGNPEYAANQTEPTSTAKQPPPSSWSASSSGS